MSDPRALEFGKCYIVECDFTVDAEMDHRFREFFHSVSGAEVIVLPKGMRLAGSGNIDLLNWLEAHEDDIANAIDDFGELKSVFRLVVGREPESLQGQGNGQGEGHAECGNSATGR